jgi:hypothetical protein
MDFSMWNTLEVAKLVVGFLTPCLLAGLGIYIHRVTKRFEDSQWRSQKLVENRLEIYSDLAPYFNDLLCYFTFIGGWKELDPPSVISLKRVLDKKIHLAAPLFSDEFLSCCTQFQSLCFETYNAWGFDARLRTFSGPREAVLAEKWDPNWSNLFADNDTTAPDEIQNAYKNVMDCFSREIGIHKSVSIAGKQSS